jgi:hypothetical protein
MVSPTGCAKLQARFLLSPSLGSELRHNASSGASFQKWRKHANHVVITAMGVITP